jgi:hypothetical protein
MSQYEDDKRVQMRVMELCGDPVVAWRMIHMIVGAMEPDDLLYLLVALERYATSEDAERDRATASELAAQMRSERPAEPLLDDLPARIERLVNPDIPGWNGN